MNYSTGVLQQVVEIKKGNPKEKTQVVYSLFQFGKDYILLIHGGETHIGSVGCSDKKSTAKKHYYTLETHREDAIVARAVSVLNKTIQTEILVVCGIHYDQISLIQIQLINQNCEELLDQLEKILIEQMAKL